MNFHRVNFESPDGRTWWEKIPAADPYEAVELAVLNTPTGTKCVSPILDTWEPVAQEFTDKWWANLPEAKPPFLVKGYVVEDGDKETLYAVLPDETVFYRVAKRGTSNFDHPRAKWHLLGLPLPQGATFIGNYPTPERKVK